MTAGSIILVRHGRTAYNAEMRLQGQVDIDLDSVGRWQIAEAAKILETAVHPALVVSSDLSRAVDTARAIAEPYGLTPVIDERLRERSFGPWEGLTGPEISKDWADDYAAWQGGAEPSTPGVELKRDVASRMVEAILEHAEALTGDQTLLVVSHGAAISCAIAGLLQQDATTWRGVAGMDNVHWSTLARNTAPAAQPAWRLVQHNIGPSLMYGKKVWNSGSTELVAAR